MTFNHRRISTMLTVTLATAIVPMTLAVVAGGQSPAVRDGNCELAEQLFPNHNPGPGSRGHRRHGGQLDVTEEGVAGDVLLEIPAVGRRGGPLPAGFLQ